jgi:hypothetical protein
VPDGVTMQTTYRSTYEPREEEAVLRSIKVGSHAIEGLPQQCPASHLSSLTCDLRLGVALW